MSQCEDILDWMKKGNKITQLDATFKFGCTRLASRIGELKKDHDIKDRMIKVPSGKSVKEYWMETKTVQAELFSIPGERSY